MYLNVCRYPDLLLRDLLECQSFWYVSKLLRWMQRKEVPLIMLLVME